MFQSEFKVEESFIHKCCFVFELHDRSLMEGLIYGPGST